MIQEASAQGVVTDSVAKKLIKYHGNCHLTPFASSTVNDNGQAISCIYFNSLPLFNYLTQYLPLPNIVLVPKFNPSKSGDVAKSPTASRNLINDDEVTLGNHKNSSGKDEKCQVAQTIENSQEQFYDDFSDQFFMGLCPKTGKNIMKMQVDMEGFLPNELSVKVVGSTLTISGCKEDEIQKIEFMRNVVLPSYVDSDQAGCYYFKGCMAIHAPISNLEAANQAQQNQVKLSSKKQSFITITQKKSTQNYNENLSNQLTDSSFENADNSSGSVTSKKTNGNNHKSVVSSKNTVHTNIPFNVAVLVNVEGHEYISLVVEVSKLFKPNEIVVKVRENKVVSVTGETRSTDESKKSRLYAFIEREFDLPKKIDRKTLKAGCTGDGLLKIFARVAT
ncbi:hypothetical protein HELRODRAFT_190058 [Helobdella robusta]|uniref:SHSP domain-containing protein n=1 Tax=Helobdella robusta TaxID=6412 RepID=T1FRM8_HELRO|nr:hypothetical protein HELRODRAFT_190058 [Helobdella robusta]ESO11769.1 hypothetical protein HELRODRAFT_190058 [Helobdella robusta]